MRQIDADALLSCIWDMYHSMEYVNDTLSHDYERRMSQAQLGVVLDVVRVVQATPTIKTEPVRHGQWVVVEPSGWNRRGYNVIPKIKCSVCEHVPKEHKTEDYGQGGTIVSYSWDRTTYCPHCGAKMDAKEESGK